MRKLITFPFLVAFLIVCVSLNALFNPGAVCSVDENPKASPYIGALKKSANIPLGDILTDDLYKIEFIENSENPAANKIPGLSQNNKLPGSASYADFMNSKIDLSKMNVEVQTSILTDMLNNYVYAENQITLISGTGDGLKGNTAPLEDLINTKGKDVSFLAIRLRDGASAGYNVDKFFQSCSTIKIPLTLYAANHIQQGNLSFDDVFTYSEGSYIDGSGVIKNYPFGTRFRLKTLLTYAIKDSDNIAYQMLCYNLGVSNLYNYLEKLGAAVKAEDLESFRFWPDSNARSSALWWSQVYSFKNSGEVGKWYWDLIGSSPSRIYTALAHSKPCYTKSGSSTYTLHEAGIVMGDDPYLVVIYTKSSTEAANTEYFFYNVAREVDKLINS